VHINYENSDKPERWRVIWDILFSFAFALHHSATLMLNKAFGAEPYMKCTALIRRSGKRSGGDRNSDERDQVESDAPVRSDVRFHWFHKSNSPHFTVWIFLNSFKFLLLSSLGNVWKLEINVWNWIVLVSKARI